MTRSSPRAKRHQQLRFEDPRLRQQDRFGGSLLKKGNAREPRPLCSKNPVHLVLRSSQARGEKSMRQGQNFKIVRQLVLSESRRHGVKLIEFVNVGNHLHLLVKLPSRHIYRRWIKRLTARLAQKIGGGIKGQKLAQKFWDYRPFTRIVRGLRGWRVVSDYLYLNQLEAWGVISRASKQLVHSSA